MILEFKAYHELASFQFFSHYITKGSPELGSHHIYIVRLVGGLARSTSTTCEISLSSDQVNREGNMLMNPLPLPIDLSQ